MGSNFTKEQLQELETRYGLQPIADVLPVRDGVVNEYTMVWWRAEGGPVCEQAIYHWDNIKEFPECYQLIEPDYKIIYTDE